MKKNYILFALILWISLISNAQNDLKIEFVTLDVNVEQTGTVDATLRITNNGSATIKQTDRIWISAVINGSQYVATGFESKGKSQVNDMPLTSEIKPGSSIISGITIAINGPTAVIDYCITVYGLDGSLIDRTTMPWSSSWDNKPSDNSLCFKYKVDEVTSVTEVSEMTDNVYFANGQLVYNWTNLNEADQAIITITNLNGQNVLSQAVEMNEGRNSLNVNSLSTGLYLVTFEVNGEFSSKKVYVK